MNKIRYVLYLLLAAGLGNREIGRMVGINHGTVARYRRILREKQKDWPDIQEMDDESIQVMLKGKRTRKSGKRIPDWESIYKRMQRPTATLKLIHEEYQEIEPQTAYQYSQFANLYSKFCKKNGRSMHQDRRCGAATYVDFSGSKLCYKNKETGEEIEVEIFVSSLGVSSKAFCYATPTQSSQDWIDAHIKMAQFYGGVTSVIVCDNLKAAVIRAGDIPVLHPTYQAMAVHYNTTIVPARVGHPQDKATVEKEVQNVGRRVLEKLEGRTFFSIDEINEAMKEPLRELNERPYQKWPGCRNSWFEELDKPLLHPLPSEPYEYAEFISAQKVTSEYHIRIKDHFYSVPNRLVGERVEARVTKNIVEFLHLGQRVASHLRSHVVRGWTTDPAHQTPEHRYYAGLTPEYFMNWGEQIGEHTLLFVQKQFENKRSDLPGRGTCSTLQKLEKQYGSEKTEAACERANELCSLTITTVRSILKSNVLNRTEEDNPIDIKLPVHQNIRGSNYYQNRSV